MTCPHENCVHHVDPYPHRPLLCRLSIHRHWQTSNTGPAFSHWKCLECDYTWIRLTYDSGWWYRLPWYLYRPIVTAQWWWMRMSYRKPLPK